MAPPPRDRAGYTLPTRNTTPQINGVSAQARWHAEGGELAQPQ